MNIVAFIPARGQSKSIPNKNIKLLGDKPLVAWSIETAKKNKLRVIVNTEDEDIANIAKFHGAEVMMRPKRLAGDKTSMFEVLQSEVFKIDPIPDAVMILQPTSPFRKNLYIQTAISYFTENLDKYDSLISVEKVLSKYSPYAMIIENHGKRMIFRKLIGLKEKLISWLTGIKFKHSLSGYPISQRMTRRQDLPDCWLPDGSIYLFKTSNLKQGSIYGSSTMLLQSEGTLNINDLDDFTKAEEICAQK